MCPAVSGRSLLGQKTSGIRHVDVQSINNMRFSPAAKFFSKFYCCEDTSSPMAITECCDLETDVPWTSINEVLPRDQFFEAIHLGAN
jgi:hypothetical protein